VIRTPSDLTGYLAALARQIPDVAHVITGEGSRQEESTKSTARYPQVLIETPETSIPASEDQKTLSTRIYVLALPQGTSHAREDIASDRAYRIIESIIYAIRSHVLDDEHGFSLGREEIDITPIISKGSDQVRGWTFDLIISIDQTCSTYDPNTFFMPQFRLVVTGDPGPPIIIITVTSIRSTTADMWYG